MIREVSFLGALVGLGLVYVGLVVAILVADVAFFVPEGATGLSAVSQGARNAATAIGDAFARREIRHATFLSLVTCTLTAILSLWVAVPIGYLLSRFRFPGKRLLDALLDVPIVVPPLVIGLSLLILFRTAPGRWFERTFFEVTYATGAIVIAQFAVSAAFAVRTLRVTFDRLDARREQVARTLGCSRSGAFFLVVLPEARGGVLAAGTLAWARALGEFGPVLVFAGATRLRTEVLPTSVFLELSIGDVEAAVAISLTMVTLAVVVLLVARLFAGSEGGR